MMRVPFELTEKDYREYMTALFDEIDEDDSREIDREEWGNYFCASREVVSRPDQWNPQENPDCRKITGFIFDCDGTIYHPSGLIQGAEDMLTWIVQSGYQYVLLSNTGSESHTSLHRKLTTPGVFECRPDGKAFPEGQCYTAADAQIDFITSGHIPAHSKLLVLAPVTSTWKKMVSQRVPDLVESWDIHLNMDVETAKEWAQHAKKRLDWENLAIEDRIQVEAPPKTAIVFFHDGMVETDWSFELLHAMTILLRFGAEFIYTAEDATNPSSDDERFPDDDFPKPGPGMFVQMLKRSMLTESRCFCCGKGGNVGRKFMIERAIRMLEAQGHSGRRECMMIVGDRFDSDIRAGTFSGIKTCLLESGAHTLDDADQFPTDIPSFASKSILDLHSNCILDQ
uniref:Uncharacterized protein n=1 Tax=Octactis speculum TaxID=3111310 RepID=A0A7S2GHG6_9STRA